jgi:putative peptide zinc metalloprotease protein
LPRVIGTAWAGIVQQQDLMAAAFDDGNVLGGVGRLLGTVALAFPVLAAGLILGRLIKRVGRGAWRHTDGRPLRRVGTVVLAGLLVAGVAFAWWPRGDNYQPIMAYERGTLVDVAEALAPDNGAGNLAVGQRGDLTTAWPNADARPTRAHPQLALVLLPRDKPASGHAEPWVFPFDKPLAPGEGDNQALAVNTKDGTVQYDVAFALVWVTDDSPALQKNESYALASCSDCAAVSIAFQVVLVTGDNHVAAPQNIAAAVNSDCVNCLTYALATQLFVTLDGPLSDDAMRQISDLWDEIAAYGANIEDVPLSDIQDQLTEFEERILAIADKGQAPEPGEDAGSTPAPVDETATPAPGGTSATPAAPDPEASPTSEPDPVETTEPSPTAEPTTSAPAPAG